MNLSLRWIVAACVLCLAVLYCSRGRCAASGVGAAESAASFDVGSRSQVFVDRILVRSAEGLEFTLRPAKKHPKGLWLRGGGPAGVVVLYDEQEKIYKSWGTSSFNTSRDGLNWGEKESSDDSWRYIIRVSVIKDGNDPDPARRYKLLTFGPDRDFPPGLADADKVTLPDGSQTLFWYCKGYNTYVSPDGRRLTHLSPKSILLNDEGKAPGDMLNGYYDRRLGLYVAFLKMTSRETKFTRRRSFAVLTSPDFQRWSEPKLVFVADETDDAGAVARLEAVRPLLERPVNAKKAATHIYGVGGPIQLESCVLALLRVYTTDGNGVSEIQMAVSRDLQHWERPFRTPIIPRGKVGKDFQSSEWDSGWFNNEGPAVEMGDEIWVYYNARNTPHDHGAGFAASAKERAEARKHIGTKYFSGTGIAVWKRDRFVSVDASAKGGTLTTVPVLYQGNRLEINAATRPGGQVVVELLDKAGKILGRSKPFSGDSLRHRVEWEAPLDLARLSGTPVTLRFRMKSAELYAFAFRE